MYVAGVHDLKTKRKTLQRIRGKAFIKNDRNLPTAEFLITWQMRVPLSAPLSCLPFKFHIKKCLREWADVTSLKDFATQTLKYILWGYDKKKYADLDFGFSNLPPNGKFCRFGFRDIGVAPHPNSLSERLGRKWWRLILIHCFDWDFRSD